MGILVTKKGTDISKWRAAGDFAATFRQAVIDDCSRLGSAEAEAFFNATIKTLNFLADNSDSSAAFLEKLTTEELTTIVPEQLKQIKAEFYGELYNNFKFYNSVPLFYHFSHRFLSWLIGQIAKNVAGLTWKEGQQEIALIAIGPSGRLEFSPFCPLQILMVYSGHLEPEKIADYAQKLKVSFEAVGFLVDPEINPAVENWRGNLTDWRKQIAADIKHGDRKELIDLLRLTDQTTLYSTSDIDKKFRELSIKSIRQSHRAIDYFVTRLLAIPAGVNIMGGLRLEKSGEYRGYFNIFNLGVLPLTASISILSLLYQLDESELPKRIRSLLDKRLLNVEMTERLLQAWHGLNEHRLFNEERLFPDFENDANLYLDINGMDIIEEELLKDSLETVYNLQRHVATVYSGIRA